jgi:hypothetical protein
MLRAAVLFFALMTLGVACASSTKGGTATKVPAGEPAPRDAHERAVEVVGARMTAMVHVDRLRKHPLAPRVASLELWGPVFEGTGIDPLADVDRIFAAGRTADDQEAAIVVAEHHVEPDRLKQGLGTLIEKSGEDGGWLEGYDFPVARVKVKDRKSVVLAVTPTVLVVTSPAFFEKAALALTGTGGLPEAHGPEALVAQTEQPSETLKAPRVPPIPATISKARMEIVMAEDGGADIAIDGDSTTPEQAKADADTLTKEVEDATTMQVAVFKVRAFDPVVFTSDGASIKARRHLTKTEIETLVGFAAMFND